MKSKKNRRGFIDIILAAILAAGSLLLPAVQSGKAFNRSVDAGAAVINSGR